MSRASPVGTAAKPGSGPSDREFWNRTEEESRVVKIAVIGTGYVGLVQGTCLAESGNDVVCIDKVAAKIESLKQGKIPIYEPGLSELVHRNRRDGRLMFTTDLAEGIAEAEIVFIAVGNAPGRRRRRRSERRLGGRPPDRRELCARPRSSSSRARCRSGPMPSWPGGWPR